MSAANAAAPMPIHRVTHEAMATTFELRLAHADARYARQAAEAAFALVDQLEALLSRYREGSDVAQLAALAPGEVARVAPDTFACLRFALEMQALTGGAFHPALGAWVDRRRAGESLGDDASAGPQPGRLLLDPATLAVQVLDAPVALDFGAIGKGFALDRVAESLAEWRLDRALLVAGGGSSVLALDGPAPGSAWPLGAGGVEENYALLRRAVGASGTAVQGEHILDPLRGVPARLAERAWAFDASAAAADAVSTAAMSLAPEELTELCRLRPGLGLIVLTPDGKLLRFGALPERVGGQAPVFPNPQAP